MKFNFDPLPNEQMLTHLARIHDNPDMQVLISHLGSLAGEDAEYSMGIDPMNNTAIVYVEFTGSDHLVRLTFTSTPKGVEPNLPKPKSRETA
jgi:hypothetical protein